jgi:para-nitrobenzyl esterase
MTRIVETMVKQGRVAGAAAGGVEVYRGIPFAEAPRGAMRFARPVPRAPWRGVFDARAKAPAAPHLASSVGAVIGLSDDHQSEDCLHATVWTPASDARGRPVMVWIHGGGF